MKKNEFENNFCLALVEEILFLRDRNPKKDWWHIWWLTKPYSYSRWNKITIDLIVPKQLLHTINSWFKSVNFNFTEWDFSTEQIYFLEKYNIFSWELVPQIGKEDIYIFPKISQIINWHNCKYIRSSLWDISKWVFSDDFLINFLFWISKDETHEYDYYFCFSESIDFAGVNFLMNSWKKNPDFLFSNIALSSYFYQQKQVNIAQKYYAKALSIDPNNPWILWNYAQLFVFRWDIDGVQIAEEMMKKVLAYLPSVPWTYDWYGEILFFNWKYIEALKVFEIYEKITEGKYRTFEAYMKRAQLYLALGDVLSAKDDILKESEYYFWEWYRERLNMVKDQILIMQKNHNLL